MNLTMDWPETCVSCFCFVTGAVLWWRIARTAYDAQEETAAPTEDPADVPVKAHVPIDKCPDCARPLAWSNNTKGGYLHGWQCKQFESCGRGSSSLGHWRWHCRRCSNDFCQFCGPEDPRLSEIPSKTVKLRHSLNGECLDVALNDNHSCREACELTRQAYLSSTDGSKFGREKWMWWGPCWNMSTDLFVVLITPDGTVVPDDANVMDLIEKGHEITYSCHCKPAAQEMNPHASLLWYAHMPSKVLGKDSMACFKLSEKVFGYDLASEAAAGLLGGARLQAGPAGAGRWFYEECISGQISCKFEHTWDLSCNTKGCIRLSIGKAYLHFYSQKEFAEVFAGLSDRGIAALFVSAESGKNASRVEGTLNECHLKWLSLQSKQC